MSSISKIIGATIAIDIDQGQTAQNIEDSLQKVEGQLNGVKFEPKSFKVINIDTKNIKFQIRDINNTIYTFQKELLQLGDGFKFGEDFTISTQPFDKAESSLNRLETTYNNLKGKLGKLDPNTNENQYKNISALLDNVDNQITDIKSNQNSLSTSTQNDLNNTISHINQMVIAYKENENAIIANEKAVAKNEKAIQNYNQSRIEMYTKLFLMQEAEAQKEVQRLDRYQDKLTETYGSVDKGLSIAISGKGIDQQSLKNVTEAITKQRNLKAELLSATPVIDSNGASWTRYTHKIKDAQGMVRQITTSVNQNSNEIRQNEKVVKNNATMTELLKGKMKELLTYFSASAIMMGFFNQLKKGVAVIKEIDDAITSLKKVTDETEASYAKFQKTAGEIGNRIGRSVPEVINATAEFAKLGYALDTATKLGEKALILTNIGDNMTLDSSTESIVATLKGFNMDDVGQNVEKNSEKIVDSLNEVSNNFAVSTVDLSEGIKRASATLNQSGVDFDHTIGLLTGVIEVLQDAETSSTGLVVLSQRIRGKTPQMYRNMHFITYLNPVNSKSLNNYNIRMKYA